MEGVFPCKKTVRMLGGGGGGGRGGLEVRGSEVTHVRY